MGAGSQEGQRPPCALCPVPYPCSSHSLCWLRHRPSRSPWLFNSLLPCSHTSLRGWWALYLYS